MIFNALMEAVHRGELILIEGGLCHWHKRSDGVVVIYEIISTTPGAGSQMLEILLRVKSQSIVARCPAGLPSNRWYQKKGFVLTGQIKTRKGAPVNVWELPNKVNPQETFNLHKIKEMK